MRKVGVLAIQGSVEEHFSALKRAGVNPLLVKTMRALNEVDGLIMPGGESTTIGKLLRRFQLRDALIERIERGMPVWGTCAGAILLANKIEGKETSDGLNVMDIVIERNSYGRQLDSFETNIEFDEGIIPAVFIRAPRILRMGKEVEAVAYEGKDVIAAREKNMFVTTFHPEMTEDLTVYKYFLKF